tara:strand:+ start:285 stop:509 length:225 start_codon:yes stop_codon:yes gene_type:complete
MDKKLRSNLAMFLLGATGMPQGLDPHTRDAAMATKHLKNSLDQKVPHSNLSDKIRDRQTAAAVYSIKTNKRWPF